MRNNLVKEKLKKGECAFGVFANGISPEMMEIMALAGFDFSRCQFRECVFDQCKLGGASFRGVSLGRSGFTRCDLRKADFRGAEGYAITLADNQLKDARFSFPEVVNLLEGTGIRIE